MLNDNNFSLECDFNKLLPFINSETEINRVVNFNKHIRKSFYPLNESFLKEYYTKTDFANLKKTFKNSSCAADVYSYFVMSYGYKNGSELGRDFASGANSSGLNPLFGVNANLGFNLGQFSWLWLLLLAAGIYIMKK